MSETSHQIDIIELSKDLSLAFLDGEISSDEQKELFIKHEGEKCDIQDSCKSDVFELQQYIKSFREAQNTSSNDIKELQKILSVSKTQRDGKITDTLFARFLQYRKDTKFLGDISDLINKYNVERENFLNLSIKDRKTLQPQGGKDAEWGQETFRYILTQQAIIGDEIPVTSIKDEEGIKQGEIGVDIITSGDTPVDTMTEEVAIPVEQKEESSQIYALRMTQKAFELEKIRLKASPEYAEAREIIKKLGRNEIKNLQEAVGSQIDGGFGVETFLYFEKSELKQAGFSIEEVAKLKKVLTVEESKNIKVDITKAYGLEPDTLDELFTDISAGDYLIYDTKLGQITLFDNETDKKTTIDVTKGIFDTIEMAFINGAKDEIFTTLARIRDNAAKENYIDQILLYIDENNAYVQARNIFCEQSGEMLHIVDFSKNNNLIQKFKAIHLFGDQEVLVHGGTTYFRIGEKFISSDKKELKILQATEIQVLDSETQNKILEDHKLRIRRKELQEKITNTAKLEGLMRALDIDSILEYSSYASPEEKKQLVDSMKVIAFEKRLFASLRLMFCDVKENSFIFKSYQNTPGVGNIFEKELTAFDLFGDYKTIRVNGEEYTAQSSKKYGISIINGNKIELVERTQRSEKEFEKLQDYPKVAEDLGKWLSNKKLGRANGNCARGVADLLMGAGKHKHSFKDTTAFGIDVDRDHAREWDNRLDTRVKNGQFIKVEINHPSEAKPGGILCYNEGSTLGTPARKRFGHVEIRSSNGYCYDGFSSEPGGSANTTFQSREQYMKATKFTGYVYYPVRKA